MKKTINVKHDGYGIQFGDSYIIGGVVTKWDEVNTQGTILRSDGQLCPFASQCFDPVRNIMLSPNIGDNVSLNYNSGKLFAVFINFEGK